MTLEQIRDEIHKEFKYASPYRVGRFSGELGIKIPCPYKPNTKSAVNFDDGIKDGRKRRLTRIEK